MDKTGGAPGDRKTEERDSVQRRSAKAVMTSVISQQLYSIPGYHILESYRDRICASLPDDYNNTALRLQTLIGASDHMIQWILTGDMSKANHRIYQVVLVYVCFEPHFIKFCDIMEVLVANSTTVLELRKALINQLCTDGHITDAEASRLTSQKLFKTPLPSDTTTLPITLNTNSVHDGVHISSTFCNSNTSAMHSANTANQKVFLASAYDEEEETTRLASEMVCRMPPSSTATMPLNVNRNNVHNSIVQVPSTFNDPTSIITCHTITTTTATTATTSSTSSAGMLLPNNHDTHDPATQQTMIPTDNHLHLSDNELKSAETTFTSKTTAVGNDESAVSSSATHESDSGCCSNEPILNLIITSKHAREAAEDKAKTQPDVNTVNSSDVQSSGYQEQHTSVTPDLKGSKDSSDDIPVSHSKLDSLPPSENAIRASTTNTTRVTTSGQPIVTTVPAKTTTTLSRNRPSIATLNLDTTSSNTSSSNDRGVVKVVLTQTRPGTTEQLEINQFIDFTMDKNILTFPNVVTLCLMTLQERLVLIKQLTESMEGLQDDINAHSERQPVSAGIRFEVDGTLFEEVRKVLEVKEFSIIKTTYAEMVACLPGNYEATIGSLQNQFSDSDICDILSLDSSHNQKILNCLIVKLKTKEDLLDFSNSLEKIDGAHSSLKRIIGQIRREALMLLCTEARPKQPTVMPDNPSSTTSTKQNTVATPPKMDFSLYPTLLVTPKVTYTCLLPPNSEGLAAVNKFYSILIENLPSNHLISLVRLQDIAFIPEEVVDSIVPSPSAEIGNKMIINYLIGLIHTEEHIITFCRCVKRMTGEFDKCIPVLNLLNLILKTSEFKEKCLGIEIISNPSSMDEVKLDPTVNCTTPVKTNEGKENGPLSSLSDDKTKTAQDPNITTLLRPAENLPCYKPYLFDDEMMLGFLQCMLINSYGGYYTSSIKATPLETPIPRSTKKSIPSDNVDKSSEEHTVTMESELRKGKKVVSKGKRTSSAKSHAIGLSLLNQDIKTIKSFIEKDCEKEYAFSLHDQPGAQRSKQFYLDSIEILFKECSKAGVWIYYNGYGEKGTGNWCFKDGTISFQEIFALYKAHLQGKLLYIYSDCCYSGQWVVDCANCLDEMGIGACGHQAIQQGMLFKIFTSCQPTQKAKLKGFVNEAVLFQDKSIRCYNVKEVFNSQTTYGCDFTRTFCMQLNGLSAPCRIPDIPWRCTWKWIDIVNIDATKRPANLVKLVRGTDKEGREAWQYVLVEKDLEEDFFEAAAMGTLDIAEHGFIVHTGLGKDPPEDFVDKLKRCCPKYCHG